CSRPRSPDWRARPCSERGWCAEPPPARRPSGRPEPALAGRRFSGYAYLHAPSPGFQHTLRLCRVYMAVYTAPAIYAMREEPDVSGRGRVETGGVRLFVGVIGGTDHGPDGGMREAHGIGLFFEHLEGVR